MNMRLLYLPALCLLAACNDGSSTSAVEQDPGRVYAEALAHVERSAADRERDAGRKPGEVLAFFGIRPGMTVLDLYSGGGYYSEILARVVGPDGRVVAHSNAAYENFVAAESGPRYADDRLANVERLMAENNALELPGAAFDAILMMLTYHDIYFVNANGGWPKLDGPRLLAELYSAARPGAVLGVVDHYAAAGSPRETGGTTHRIDKATVIQEIEAAGFVLDGESDILRNPDDDYSRNVFEPDLRGRTDRFVLRFRKPRD